MARKNDADVVKLWKQKKIQQSGCRKKTWWYWWDGVKVHMKSFVALTGFQENNYQHGVFYSFSTLSSIVCSSIMHLFSK